MSYVCSCGRSWENQTPAMNHVRMKAQNNDHDHSISFGNQAQDDSGTDLDTPDGWSTEEKEETGDSLNDVEVEEIKTAQKQKEQTSSYVPIGEASIPKLVKNGHASNQKEAVQKLKKAQANGNSKINPETGDLK